MFLDCFCCLCFYSWVLSVIVIKALRAEGDSDFQRTAMCFMRATTGEVSGTEVWMYNRRVGISTAVV